MRGNRIEDGGRKPAVAGVPVTRGSPRGAGFRLAIAAAASVSALLADHAGQAAPDQTGAEERPGCAEESAQGTSRAGISLRTRIRAATLAKGFGVQYWGTVYNAASLAAAPHGILIVEPAHASGKASADGGEIFFTASEVRHMRRNGARPVLAYLNVGRIEIYRDYWNDRGAEDERPDWQAGVTAAGEPVPAYWSDAWLEVLRTRLDRFLDLGFDGVILDDVLRYFELSTGTVSWTPFPDGPAVPSGAQAHARAMMALVKTLRHHADARRCGTILIVNNGAFIGRDAGPDPGAHPLQTFDTYRNAIDGILVESLFTPEPQAAAVAVLAEDYVSVGTPVLDVEFASLSPDLGPAEFRGLVARRTAALGAVGYIAETQAFDHLAPPINRSVGAVLKRSPLRELGAERRSGRQLAQQERPARGAPQPRRE